MNENNALFGYTGFVGSNLLTKYVFNELYNSKNINLACNKGFDNVFISCIPAVKWYANNNPENDLQIINNLIDIFKTIKANKIILISTIDVYDNIINKNNEDYKINYENNHAYGRNRYLFELFIKNNKNIKSYHIIRLPALFGNGIKKNIIYDLINNNNVNIINGNSSYQWYNLEWLKQDIDVCINNNIKECNLFTEPLETNEIIKLFQYENINFNMKRFKYNLQTKYYDLFNSNVIGYIRDKTNVLNDIISFISNYKIFIKNQKLINQLCISNISLNNLNSIQYYSILKHHNIKNIEIAPTKINNWSILYNVINNNKSNYNYDNNEFNNFFTIVKEYNINVCSFQSIAYNIDSNIFSENCNLLLEHLKKVIDLAIRFNIKNLVFGCPKNRFISNNDINIDEINKEEIDKKYDDLFIKFMRNLGEYIGDRNLIISIENNSKLYNCNYLNTVSQVGSIVQKIDNENIKMMIDIGNMIMENDIIDFNDIMRYKKLINHIHISSPHLKSLINYDDKYYAKFINFLKIINYNKLISLEFISNLENIQDELDELNISIKNFKNLCKNLINDIL